jgi:alpha-tubulin suppressor-like RCC1 family protein
VRGRRTDCSADPLTGIATVAVDRSVSLALGTDGTVVGWGFTFRDQLGDGTTTSRTSPVRVCAVNATDCTTNPLTGVTGIALGYSHSLALVAGGATLSWGNNRPTRRRHDHQPSRAELGVRPTR